MNDELIREGRRIIVDKFIGWRTPPVELPADSVIREAVKEILELRDKGNQIEKDGHYIADVY